MNKIINNKSYEFRTKEMNNIFKLKFDKYHKD